MQKWGIFTCKKQCGEECYVKRVIDRIGQEWKACGDAFSIVEFDGIEERFGIKTPDLKPNYNVAPSQDVPVITGNRVAMFRWGLIPFWAKDPSIGNKMINAKVKRGLFLIKLNYILCVE